MTRIWLPLFLLAGVLACRIGSSEAADSGNRGWESSLHDTSTRSDAAAAARSSSAGFGSDTGELGGQEYQLPPSQSHFEYLPHYGYSGGGPPQGDILPPGLTTQYMHDPFAFLRHEDSAYSAGDSSSTANQPFSQDSLYRNGVAIDSTPRLRQPRRNTVDSGRSLSGRRREAYRDHFDTVVDHMAGMNLGGPSRYALPPESAIEEEEENSNEGAVSTSRREGRTRRRDGRRGLPPPRWEGSQMEAEASILDREAARRNRARRARRQREYQTEEEGPQRVQLQPSSVGSGRRQGGRALNTSPEDALLVPVSARVQHRFDAMWEEQDLHYGMPPQKLAFAVADITLHIGHAQEVITLVWQRAVNHLRDPDDLRSFIIWTTQAQRAMKFCTDNSIPYRTAEQATMIYNDQRSRQPDPPPRRRPH